MVRMVIIHSVIFRLWLLGHPDSIFRSLITAICTLSQRSLRIHDLEPCPDDGDCCVNTCVDTAKSEDCIAMLLAVLGLKGYHFENLTKAAKRSRAPTIRRVR